MDEAKKLKTWSGFQRLKDRHWESVVSARARNKALILTSSVGPHELMAGWDDDVVVCMGETYAANNAANEELIVSLLESAEEHGYDRNLCPYMKAYVGSMYSGRSFTGKFTRPDICVADVQSPTHGQWLQRVSEHLKIPYFALSHVYWTEVMGDHHIDYYVAQFYEFIEWMEKQTGLKWNEEKFLQGYMNYWRVKELWSEITSYQKTIPAPLDLRLIANLLAPTVYLTLERDSVTLYEQLLDEVRERVEHNIGATPNERLRLAYQTVPQWHHLRDLRYIEGYGAAFVAGGYVFWFGSDWLERRDGSIGRPEWVGKEPKNIDEAFRHIAERALGHPWRIEAQVKVILKMVKEYKIDAVVIHATRGSEPELVGWEYLKGPLEKMGMPVLAYEGSMADPRHYTPDQVVNRMDAFLESLGLAKGNR